MVSKILLVDDDPGIRFIASISLVEVGKFEALMVESGRKALEVVSDFRPDVILLDVMMPGLDGPATFELLRKKPGIAQVPIIFITAKVQKHEVQSYYNLGAAGVLLKPFDPITLPQQIATVVQSWRALSTGANNSHVK
ncbi:MAG TPA: response regulator [Candidatus Obscuribacterales bacterium]